MRIWIQLPGMKKWHENGMKILIKKQLRIYYEITCNYTSIKLKTLT